MASTSKAPGRPASTSTASTGISRRIYRDGKISGKGKAGIEKGRVKGEVTVFLLENHTLTGEGKVSVQITDNLVGTVGVVLDEKKKVHVKGEIAFPKPITLFDRFPRGKEGQDKELFKVGQDIGIPGLSIGTFGVVAHIGARLGVSYYVGPGVLKDVKLEAGFDPLEETKNLAVHGHAVLVIPAHAGVYLLLEGGLGLSAVIASVHGGLTVKGELGLDAVLKSVFDLDYRDGRFSFDAKPEIRAGINARLALGAFVDAQVGIGPLKAGTRKDWELKAYAWSGPTFGVVFPLHYASNEPFHAPSFDQIQIRKTTDRRQGAARRHLRRGAIEREGGCTMITSNTSFPDSPPLMKGAIISFDPLSPPPTVIAFQYNPDTLTRSLEARGAQGPEAAGRAEAQRLAGPPKETLSLSIELDGTESGSIGTAASLAALELLLYPSSTRIISEAVQAMIGVVTVVDPPAPITLFIWGPTRVIPVRITSLAILEEAFNPNLGTIRAKVDLKMDVLSTYDLSLGSIAYNLALAHQVAGIEALAIARSAVSLAELGISLNLF